MNFSLYFPRNIVFGKNMIQTTGKHVSQWGTRCLIITGSSSAGSGTLNRLLESLEENQVQYQVFDRVTQEPTCDLVDQARAIAREGKPDAVIGLGGGSPLDVAKATAGLYNQTQNTLAYLNKAPFVYNGIPFIGIPTTSGTGSEITLNTVLYNDETQNKTSLAHPNFQAVLSIIDPTLTASLSPALTAMTGMDALTHAIESYTSIEANPVTRALARSAIELAGRSLLTAVKKNTDQAREEMALSSLLAALAFTQTGVGLAHAISHPLGALFHIPHGVANALLLAEVMDFNEEAAPQAYREIAFALGGYDGGNGSSGSGSTSSAGQLVRDLVAALPLPSSLKAAGYLAGQEELLVQGALQSRSLKKNPRAATPQDILDIVAHC